MKEFKKDRLANFTSIKLKKFSYPYVKCSTPSLQISRH